ncbi:MAG: folate family ECF transporter S component [Clostridia bacterium]|nr:folate family ECF transporter S component [Clostridia bacterium]
MKNSTGAYLKPSERGYLKSAAGEFRNVRSLVMAALLSAAAIVIEYFQVPIIPGVLEVSFSCVAISLCSFLTGPVVAIPCGIIVDTVGAIIKGYSFFFGYTLSAVLGAVIYALFLYRSRLSFSRIVFARATVNIFVNVLLGSVWRLSMSGGEYGYYVAISLIKNLLMLPLEVFMTVLFFEALMPSLKRMKLCSSEQRIRAEWWKIAILAAVLAAGTALLVIYSLNKSEINGYIKSLF